MGSNFVLNGCTALLCAAALGAAVPAGTPANDECAGAIAIPLGSTPFATGDASLSGFPFAPDFDPTCIENDPTFAADVWFLVTPPQLGTLFISTCGQASFDTKLAVYSGFCGFLTLEGCDDDEAGFALGTSTLLLNVAPLEQLFIRVGGSTEGSGILTVLYEGETVACPPATHLCTVTGAPGCTNEDCCLAVCNFDVYCCQVNWDGICTTEALIFCDGSICANATHDCFIEGTAGCEDPDCCGPVCDVDPACCSSAWDVDCVMTAVILCAPITCGPPARPGTEHDCFTVGGPGCYSDPCCGSVQCCDDVCEIDSFCCQVEWDSQCVSEAVTLCEGFGGWTNDGCLRPLEIFLGDTPFIITGSTLSTPVVSPAFCDDGLSPDTGDLWFYFDAPSSGKLRVSTCGQANFDSRLEMYQFDVQSMPLSVICSNFPGPAQFNGCNDNAPHCPGLTSEFEANISAGEEFLIRVFGKSDGLGTLTLEYVPPSNDLCANAETITEGTTSDSFTSASNEGSATGPCSGIAVMLSDLWYVYTPSCDGSVLFSLTTDGVPFSEPTAVVEAYDTCPALGGQYLFCISDLSSQAFDLTCGQLYWLRVSENVGGLSLPATSFSLELTCQSTTRCKASPCPADLDGNGVVDGADFGLLLGNWGQSGLGDLDGNGTVDGADFGLLLGAWGQCQ